MALRCSFLLGLASLALAPTNAGAQAPAAAVKAEIWAKEQAIYRARAAGDLGVYVSGIADGYRAWPPGRPAPIGPEGLKRDAGAMAGRTREVLTMALTDFSLNGDTAVVYYRNHRTSLPDGTAVDQVFDNIHVWVRENGSWRLLGGMSRQGPEAGR